MLERSFLHGRQGTSLVSGSCNLFAMWRLHHGRVRPSVVHLGLIQSISSERVVSFERATLDKSFLMGINTYHAKVPIYRRYSLVGSGLQQLACDDLLNSQHDSIFTPDADRGSTILYGFSCIFDLVKLGQSRTLDI